MNFNQISFVRPGVRVKEIDESTFVALQPTLLEGCVIGLTEKGPAFKPISVNGYNDFANIFGLDVDYSLSHMAKVLFQSIGDITIVRVLGEEGHESAGSYVNICSSGSVGQQAAFILASDDATASGSITFRSYDDFDLSVDFASSDTETFASASLNESDGNFLGNLISSDLDNALTKGSHIAVYHDYITYTGLETDMSASISCDNDNTGNQFDSTYKTATTPWIKSQEIGGQNYELFQFEALQSGFAGNKIKIGVTNIVLADESVDSYSNFVINVMEYGGTILESFNCSFNPESVDYILKSIGDELWAWDTNKKKLINSGGNYPNQSDYIRIKQLKDFPNSAAPKGFAGYGVPYLISISASIANLDYKLNQNNDAGYEDTSIYMGLTYDTDKTIVSFFAWHGDMYSTSGSYSDFELPSASFFAPSGSKATRKFAFSPSNGFDGLDYFAMNQSDSLYTHKWFSADSAKTTMYKKAIDTISDPLQVDIAWLILPYVTNAEIQTYALNVARNRGDVAVYLEATNSTTISDATNAADNFDTSYGAMYFPGLQKWDSDSKQFINISPLAYVAKAVGYTDDSYKHWYPHAGIDRGKITGARAIMMLSQDDIEELYNHGVNPIPTFAKYGPTIWGNKTLYHHDSALNRIHARKLLIYLKKAIANVGYTLNFEPNVGRTWDRFINKVEPFLEEARRSYGLTSYRIKMDKETNTDSIMQQNIMFGQIYLTITNIAEEIYIEFKISPTGTEFNVIEG